MRLFHISDLHLGKKLNEASLIADQRHMLTQVIQWIDQEKPDAMLIAGDVYDKPVPPAEAVAMLDDFLTALALRHLPVILISGNHDSPDRLAFGARLFEASGVYVSPVFDVAHATIAPVRLKDALGSVWLWPLPFVKPAHVRAALPGQVIETYTDALRAAVAQMPLDTSQRNVLIAHQFITGSTRSESEDVSVGGLDNVDIAVFEAFDYVALGHLHHAQAVGRDGVRYSGSPLKYSFAEAKDPKSVTLVELGAKGDVSTRALPLMPLRDLREVRGLYDELTLLRFYQNTAKDDYLHITLTDEADVPDALSKLQVIYPNLLKLDYDNARTRETRQVNASEAPERRSPLDLLADFYTFQNNRPMDEDQRRYAQIAMERVWGERV